MKQWLPSTSTMLPMPRSSFISLISCCCRCRSRPAFSTFTTARSTSHLMTNAWNIGQFAIADISIEQGMPCRANIQPRYWR
jgi:hypothetical protein